MNLFKIILGDKMCRMWISRKLLPQDEVMSTKRTNRFRFKPLPCHASQHGMTPRNACIRSDGVISPQRNVLSGASSGGRGSVPFVWTSHFQWSLLYKKSFMRSLVKKITRGVDGKSGVWGGGDRQARLHMASEPSRLQERSSFSSP